MIEIKLYGESDKTIEAVKNLISSEQEPKEKLFTPEQEEAIRQAENSNLGRPRKETLIRKGVQAGLEKDFTRATFIISVATLEDVKNYAYTKRLSMKVAVDRLLRQSIEAYIANGGTLLDRNKSENNKEEILL